MEGGSLADVLHAAQLTGSGPLSELVIGKLAARVLASLNYLHRERHQVHRDMKPGNILLNCRGEIKISDFGLSAELDSTKEMCATFIGTHAYMSPERLGGKPYSFASDIWSLGITLVECALGQAHAFGLGVDCGMLVLWRGFVRDGSVPPVSTVSVHSLYGVQLFCASVSNHQRCASAVASREFLCRVPRFHFSMSLQRARATSFGSKVAFPSICSHA